ncbi:class I SAM-dependent methyltransferase [Candidatus Woesearchaeota archaeon]|nr:class I SAM-dependent methyltransferase [Candidatus Woesearchaeota archaeon]
MRPLHKILKEIITKKEIKKMPASFDVIGEIAIIEVPKELKKKEKKIAQKIIETFKQVKTVAKKAGIHKGEFRTRKTKIIGGEKTKETIQKESGTIIKLNIDKCYYSPRYGTERLRIAKQVKEGEKILVMFSGVGPFPLVIAKNSKPEKIVGVEKNPECHKYALENKKLNKKTGEKIEFIEGDVKNIVPKIKNQFDRVAMPLPKGGENFLSTAIRAVKPGGILHFYDFATPEKFEESANKIIEECKKEKRKCKVLRITKCGEVKPRTYRICIDATIT